MKYIRISLFIYFMISSMSLYAVNTVIAVTNVLGQMTNVTLSTPRGNFKYSTCNNETPYTYPWRIDDVVHISVNTDFSVWTLNNLTTAAIAVCIKRTSA